jgi:hypothetical protein
MAVTSVMTLSKQGFAGRDTLKLSFLRKRSRKISRYPAAVGIFSECSVPTVVNPFFHRTAKTKLRMADWTAVLIEK